LALLSCGFEIRTGRRGSIRAEPSKSRLQGLPFRHLDPPIALHTCHKAWRCRTSGQDAATGFVQAIRPHAVKIRIGGTRLHPEHLRLLLVHASAIKPAASTARPHGFIAGPARDWAFSHRLAPDQVIRGRCEASGSVDGGPLLRSSLYGTDREAGKESAASFPAPLDNMRRTCRTDGGYSSHRSSRLPPKRGAHRWRIHAAIAAQSATGRAAVRASEADPIHRQRPLGSPLRAELSRPQRRHTLRRSVDRTGRPTTRCPRDNPRRGTSQGALAHQPGDLRDPPRRCFCRVRVEESTAEALWCKGHASLETSLGSRVGTSGRPIGTTADIWTRPTNASTAPPSLETGEA